MGLSRKTFLPSYSGWQPPRRRRGGWPPFPPFHLRTLPLILILFLPFAFCLLPYSYANYADGDGSTEFPFQIAEPNQLIYMSQHPEHWNKHFILTADINLALADPNTFDTAFIAPDMDNTNYDFDGIPFTGVFDGNGHTISNLTIDTSGADNDYLGLFGRIDGSQAEVKYLGLENVNITGGDDSDYLGGLCGWNNSNISNCYTTGLVTSGNQSFCLGGICGRNQVGSISNCYATSLVNGGDDTYYLGGLCGWNYNGIINNCYSTGSVFGGVNSHSIGGVCGSNYGGINNSFWDIQLSGILISNGGIGLSTEQMLQIGTYYAWGLHSNENIWTIDEGNDYPHLYWENKVGTPISSPQYLSDVLEGTGESDDPYLIYTAQQVDKLRFYTSEYDKHYELMADINMSLAEPNIFDIAVIAPDTSASSGFQGTLFTGIFNGNGHAIYNLTIDDAGASNDFLGLFGQIDSGGRIINLGMINVNIISGGSYLGGLCGYNNSGSISQCYTTGSLSGGAYLGGLCGINFNGGSISKCFSLVSVAGGYRSYDLGGLCGWNEGYISNCYATGSVIGGDDSRRLGGLCGVNDNNGRISNCYAIGLVNSEEHSGDLGGLVGRNYTSVFDCFWDIQTSGRTISSGGKGLNTSSMQVASTYYSWGVCGNENIWTINEEFYYPRLAWENQPGSLISHPGLGEILNGSGDPNDPYIIYTPQELTLVSLYPCGVFDKHYKLMTDINMSLAEPNIFTTALIGRSNINNIPFTGSFEGNGHIISNLTINTTGRSKDALGLFGRAESPAKIMNLSLVNVNIINGHGSMYLGSLIGSNGGSISNCYACSSVSGGTPSIYLGVLCGYNSGNINDCYASGSVTGGNDSNYLGGLCGSNEDGSISNCYAICSVTGGYDSDYLGGLCGSNEGGSISDCYAIGSIIGEIYSCRLGGLCGMNTGSIINCYASGMIISAKYSMFLGGLCGINYSSINNCYAIGSVTGYSAFGGLCGRNDYGNISKCYATSSVNGGENSRNFGGLCGVNWEGTITNCYSTGPVSSGDGCENLGGFCGYNREGSITSCYSCGSVTDREGSFNIGGLCGWNDQGIISNCYASGSVTGVDGSVTLGGLCGRNNYGNISNCYATGSIANGNTSGGLCGNNWYGIIRNCYSTGSVIGGDDSRNHGGLCGLNCGNLINCYATGAVNGVSGSEYLGGLCGRNYPGSISNCYFLDSAGPDNGLGTPLPDPNMRIQDSFVGWDFVGEETNGTEDHWQLCIDAYDYPRLAWQFINPADFLRPGRVDNYDLFVLTHDWLQSDSPCCDIYPPEGDNIVNLLDYLEFTNHWLTE